MSYRIENPGSPEDYVDGLKHKKPANSYSESDEEIIPVTEPDIPRQTVKGVDAGPYGPIQCLTYGAVFVLGVTIGTLLVREEHSTGSPVPSPTETVVITAPARPAPRPTIPESCQRALTGFEKYLDGASRVASVTDQQLDIFEEAYQAILLRQYKKLNDLSERQRTLDSTLASDKANVLPNYQSLKKDIAQCRSQSG